MRLQAVQRQQTLMNTKSSFLRASALGFLLSTSIHAAVIFDNLEPPGSSQSIASSSWVGQSFVVDANNYTLTSVVFPMLDAFDSGGNFFVRIYDATGPSSAPGTSLAELIGSANPASAGNYIYLPDGTVNLNANTTYYVVLGVSSGSGHYLWRYEFPAATIETGSAVGYSFSAAPGTSWTAPVNDGVVYNMQVNAVPEPVNVALGIFGLLFSGILSFRWWNNRRAKLSYS